MPASPAGGDAGSEAGENLLEGEPGATTAGPPSPPPPPPGSPTSMLASALVGTPPGRAVAQVGAAGGVPVVVVEHKHVHQLDLQQLAALWRPLQSLSEGFTAMAQQAAVFNANFSAATGAVAGQLQAVAAETRGLSEAMHTLWSLSAQGRLAAKAMHCGLLLHVAAAGCCAATRGRLPEISATCAAQGRTGGPNRWLGGLMPGMMWSMETLRALRCYAKELGEVSAGLAGAVLLFYMWRFSLQGADLRATWALDVPVVLGVVAAASGARVVAHLGGSWLVWLLLWWVWCGALLGLCRRRMGGWRQGAVALAVAVALPVAGGVAPFTVAALRLHAAAREMLGQLLPGLLGRVG